MKKKVILITGPTAVGKTAAAIQVARYFNTDIISADSRQCFKELSIGVARPSSEELNTVQHHFIATHSIQDLISAASFEQYALEKADEIFARNDVIIMAGGTGLYVKAFMEGMDEIPSVDPAIREELMQLYEIRGMEWLEKTLREEDPLYATEGSMNNPQRMLRALEVMRATGQSIRTYQQKNKKIRPFDIISIRLDLPREELYQRINNRVEQMMQNGLREEAQELYPYRHLNALQTVGYKEIFDHIEGKCSMQEAVELIKRNTRHFAKRQCTWFANQLPAELFHPEDINSILKYILLEASQIGEKSL